MNTMNDILYGSNAALGQITLTTCFSNHAKKQQEWKTNSEQYYRAVKSSTGPAPKKPLCGPTRPGELP